MKTGDKVTIGGRTKLGAMSLVGMTGTIVPTAPNAPVGNMTVLVDWVEAGFSAEEIETLPALVNVPLIFLTLVEEDNTKPPQDDDTPSSSWPKLRLV